MTDTLTVRRAIGAVFALVLALVSLSMSPLYAADGAETTHDGRTLFTKGHIDAFNVTGDSSGVSLNLKEDVTGSHVAHSPESVVLGISDDAWQTDSEKIGQIGSSGYFLPLTQNHAIIWPGWDSLGTKDFTKLTYTMTSLSGPGQVYMFSSDFGGLKARTDNGSFTLSSGSSWTQTYAAHEHINWIFTKPGTYTMTVKADATFNSGTKSTNSATYTWAVGNDSIESFRTAPVVEVTPKPVTFDDTNLTYTVPQVTGLTYSEAAGTHTAEAGQKVTVTASATKGYAIADGATTTWSHTFPVADEPGEDDNENEPGEGDNPGEGEKPDEGDKPGDENKPGEGNEPGEGDQPEAQVIDTVEAPIFDGLTMTIPADDRVAYVRSSFTSADAQVLGPIDGELKPGTHTFAEGDMITISAIARDGFTFKPGLVTEWSHTFTAQADDKPADPAPADPAPANPQPGKPAPKPAAPKPAPAQPAVPTCIPTEVTTPGGTTTKVGGSYTVPANTHAHPNWVFTKPGTYKATITQTATIEGKKLSTSGVVTFNVGGAGNANDGHFDIGTAYEHGKLTMLIKDDRQVPATWVAPSSLTFGLSDAAKATAPAGMEFIAPAGAQVWMISASQVAGVPWVGANTMHPSLKGTTEVTWTLSNVSGPGAMAVFSSGNLSAIGQQWFGGQTTGSDTVTYVGKTADGKDCELSADVVADLEKQGKKVDSPLARTGAYVGSLALLAAVLTMAGIALRRKSA